MSSVVRNAVDSARLAYTESRGNRGNPDMPIIWSRFITEHTVLRVLITGFALVLLLLGVASVTALRGTRSIQADADAVMREELAIARLLNEVQAEETAMATVLHRLNRPADGVDRQGLIDQLRQADQSLTRAAKAAGDTPEKELWRKLEGTVRQFSDTAQSAIRRSDYSENTLQQLFLLHDSVVSLVQHLVTASMQRAGEVDRLLSGRSRELADESLSLLGTCFLLALICSILTVRMATSSIRRIKSQSTELSQVSWHMLQSQEDAARRFSHELHDELGQSLAAIRANLTGIRESDLQVRRADCIHLVDEAIANVRELSQLLRPVILDDFGLDAALRWLTEKFSQRTSIAVDYSCDFGGRLRDESETHLFRIAQEALTNVARHSGATHVSVRLTTGGGQIRLTIEDNGRGIPATAHRPSLGMVGMRARSRQAGGELLLTSPSYGGLKLQVCIPADKVLREHDKEDAHSIS